MLIDWFTVAAQALNFIILVWLLKRFLYKPILTIIDARENRIATEIADASRQKDEAKKERGEFEGKNKRFGEERAAMMANAVLDVKAEREKLLVDAQREANELLTNQKAAMTVEASALVEHLKRLATIEVFNIVRRTLTDLASADLEERLAEAFTRRLRQLQPASKELLVAGLKAPNATAVVRSRFDLSDSVKATIRNALNETFSVDLRLRFETAPDSICGIELTAGGQKLAWSISEYVNSLEEKAAALLRADHRAATVLLPGRPPAPVSSARALAS